MAIVEYQPGDCAQVTEEYELQENPRTLVVYGVKGDRVLLVDVYGQQSGFKKADLQLVPPPKQKAGVRAIAIALKLYHDINKKS